jgi:hypothetical protein
MLSEASSYFQRAIPAVESRSIANETAQVLK